MAKQRLKIRGLNRVRYGDRTYVYHRASGIQLPNLEETSPAFIRAYKAAETVHRNRQAEAETRITPLPTPEPAAPAAPIKPDALAFQPEHAITWLYNARDGQIVCYHVGQLARDQRTDHSAATKRRYFAIANDFGLVRLRQARDEQSLTYYYAKRTDISFRGMPSNVLTGAVDPLDYQAVHALTERRADQSIARCLRDELGISENEASELRNSMIRRGWLTNGRPPELTTRGLSVIA